MQQLALSKKSNDVYITTQSVVQWSEAHIYFLIDALQNSSRGRVRICAHQTNDSLLHEMIIAINQDSYIRPHRHPYKTESFHVIDGCADVVIFTEEGKIQQVIKLGEGGAFYYRLSAPLFHTLVIHTPTFIIHEITNGPFDESGSQYANFSPHEDQLEEVQNYVAILRSDVQKA